MKEQKQIWKEIENFSNLKEDDFEIPKRYLKVNPQEIRLFKARHICDHRRFNIGLYFVDIDFDLFKIFSTIEEINIYLLNEKEFSSTGKIFPWSNYINTINDLVTAIKCLYLVISDDEFVIKLAASLGKKVFALCKKENDRVKKYENIIPFFYKNGWTKVLPEVKEELEKYRVDLREKYLLSCIEQYKKDNMRGEVSFLEAKALIFATLFKETYKTIYLNGYLEIEELLQKKFPHDIRYQSNLATFYAFGTNRAEDAGKIWEKILPKIDPQKNPDFLFNYACFSCLTGDLETFWKYYEYRFKKHQNPTKYPNFDKPKWQGEKDTLDKTLLVYYEQGFGDNILFCRYLNDVKKIFKNVIFVVKKELEMLMKDSFSGIKVYSREDFQKEEVDFDYHCPVISLGYCLNVKPEKYKKKKWLKANKQKVKDYKQYFSDDKFNIGIFWESTKNNLHRHTDLKTLMPLAYIDKVQLYSLHIDKEDFELNYLDDNVNIVNLGKHFKDFSDTAAAIENCDLVIATDSSVMNLAGALGIKTFALFNEIPEWRWYNLKNNDTAWYKTIKPFQAKEQNNFAPEIEKICSEIEVLIKNNERFK